MNWENSKTGGGGLQWRNENEKCGRACLLRSYGPVLMRLPPMRRDAINTDHPRNHAACIPQLAKYSHDEWRPEMGGIFAVKEYRDRGVATGLFTD
jgi:hypothetical protein